MKFNSSVKRQMKLIINLLLVLIFLYFTFEVFPQMMSGGTLEIMGGIFIMLVLIVVLGNLIVERALNNHKNNNETKR